MVDILLIAVKWLLVGLTIASFSALLIIIWALVVVTFKSWSRK